MTRVLGNFPPPKSLILTVNFDITFSMICHVIHAIIIRIKDQIISGKWIIRGCGVWSNYSFICTCVNNPLLWSILVFLEKHHANDIVQNLIH